VGEVDSWHTVESLFKSQGILTQLPKGKGWSLYDEEYKTLKAIRDKFRQETEFRNAITSGLISHAINSSGFVQEGDDEPFDPETGELGPGV